MTENRMGALATWLRDRGSVVVAFSGGVDSAYLAVSARDVLGPERSLAVIGVSPSLPGSVLARARALAASFAVNVREIATNELDDPDYAANRGDRCFHCKTELWRRLLPVAAAGGFACVADGTIVDDLAEHRPGKAAGDRAGIASPLAECGFTKSDVRAAARARGIPVWNAPAAPCLASRVATGVRVTRDQLTRVDRAECALRALGIDGDLRVRVLGDDVRIELPPGKLGEWSDERRHHRLVAAVRAHGFARVFLDLRGYRRGALQDARPAAVVEITDAPENASGDTLF
jgi:uncharacterized protein